MEEIKVGICGLCGESCLVDARLKDGKLVNISGHRDQAYSHGKLCVKGAGLRQYMYSKKRLAYPMKRIGPAGTDDFVRISWDEALDTIAEELVKVREEYGPKHTMVYVGHPKWFRPQASDFAASYGTPNYGTESSTCAYALMLAAKTCFGKDVMLPRPDLDKTQTVLVWGVNPKYSNEVKRGRAFQKLVDDGKKVIVIDPRCTPTTEEAHIHLRPLPGTDGALALAMAKVIVENDLHDKAYIEKYCYGFEDYANYVMNFDLAKAESITGVPAEDIERTAILFAKNTPSSIMMSASPVVHNINGVQNARAILLLAALVGAYGVEGGINPPGPERAHLKGTFMGKDSRIPRTLAQDDLSSGQFPAWAELIYEEAQVSQMGRYLKGQGPYPIKSLLAFGMNHHMWPRPDLVEEGMEKLDFFACADPFFTETCKYAHIVLPVAIDPERSHIQIQGRYRIKYVDKIIEPLGEAKTDMEILIELGKRMGIELVGGARDYEGYLESLLEPTGLSLNDLKASEDGLASKENLGYRTSDDILKVQTPSGKIEFKAQVLEKFDLPYHDALPIYRDFRETLPMEDFPLLLATGSRKPQLFHSRTYRMPWLMSLEQAPVIDIHPDDGLDLGIEDGEIVKIVTPVGQMKLKANFDTSCLPDLVNVYHGIGDEDINYLVDDKYLDPISGFPGYKSYCCRIERLEEKNV